MQPSLQAPVSVNVTLALPSSALCSITAVSRVPNSMEVWWIGTDASVRDAILVCAFAPCEMSAKRTSGTNPSAGVSVYNFTSFLFFALGLPQPDAYA